MIKSIIVSAAMLVAIATSAQGQQPTEDVAADVRCLVVSLRLIHSENPVLRVGGQQAELYWVGRLDGRAPGADLQSLVSAADHEMNEAKALTETKRCSRELAARELQMPEVGNQIVQHDRAQPPSSPM